MRANDAAWRRAPRLMPGDTARPLHRRVDVAVARRKAGPPLHRGVRMQGGEGVAQAVVGAHRAPRTALAHDVSCRCGPVRMSCDAARPLHGHVGVDIGRCEARAPLPGGVRPQGGEGVALAVVGARRAPRVLRAHDVLNGRAPRLMPGNAARPLHRGLGITIGRRAARAPLLRRVCMQVGEGDLPLRTSCGPWGQTLCSRRWHGAILPGRPHSFRFDGTPLPPDPGLPRFSHGVVTPRWSRRTPRGLPARAVAPSRWGASARPRPLRPAVRSAGSPLASSFCETARAGIPVVASRTPRRGAHHLFLRRL